MLYSYTIICFLYNYNDDTISKFLFPIYCETIFSFLLFIVTKNTNKSYNLVGLLQILLVEELLIVNYISL